MDLLSRCRLRISLRSRRSLRSASCFVLLGLRALRLAALGRQCQDMHSFVLALYGFVPSSAVTTELMPPRTLNLPVTRIHRGSHAAANSSNKRLTTAS